MMWFRPHALVKWFEGYEKKRAAQGLAVFAPRYIPSTPGPVAEAAAKATKRKRRSKLRVVERDSDSQEST